MKKLFYYAMMAMMMMGSAVVISACESSSDSDDPDSGEVDTRLDNVVPKDIRDKMGRYITFYNGVNPPNVEGVYLMSPDILVYSSDNTFSIGDVFSDLYFRLSNQNSKNNTIDYQENQGKQTQVGSGAFISGEGNNFTIFFNNTGKIYDIKVKTAMVISGTKTSSGIANLRYALALIDKDPDPDNIAMEIGEFRIFEDKDGLTEFSEWPTGTRAGGFSIELPSFVSGSNLEY